MKPSFCYISTEHVREVWLSPFLWVMGWRHFKIQLIADIYPMPDAGTVLNTYTHYLISSPHQPCERGAMITHPGLAGQVSFVSMSGPLMGGLDFLGEQEPC